MTLSHQRLLELLHYEPSTGLFTRRVAVSNRRAGEVAGCLDQSEGYIRIRVDGRGYWAHRLAWFYMTGRWPEQDVDHKNRSRSDNTWENLREATRSQNLLNQEDACERSKSGVRGVAWDSRRRKWKVCISVGNRTRHVGRFDDIATAEAAYRAAKANLLPHAGGGM